MKPTDTTSGLPPRWLAYGLLALSMALVGSYVALSKPLAAALPVFLLAWMRFGIGALAMPHWLIKPSNEPVMTGKTRWLIFLESFLGNFLFTICMLLGVSMTTAVSAGVIMAAIPAVVALLSWAFLRELRVACDEMVKRKVDSPCRRQCRIWQSPRSPWQPARYRLR